jgi:formylglycine-generating enzyme required for sulfatase activity
VNTIKQPKSLLKNKVGNSTEASSLEEITNSIGMKLVLIPKGSFTMGSPVDEIGSDDGEQQHEVTLTKDYYLGIYEVTQAQYMKVMGNNPSEYQGDILAERHPVTNRIVKKGDSSNFPVEQVSWEDAIEFCKQLSALPEEKKAGRVYRLPTEAEWEYACRAGSKTAFCFGNDAKLLGEYAWFGGNSEEKRIGESRKVGMKKPNNWGLYDMHGNIGEWCYDTKGVYPEIAVTDPVNIKSPHNRVIRGGNRRDASIQCRSAYRGGGDHSKEKNALTGFRVVSGSELPLTYNDPQKINGVVVKTGDPQFTLTWDTDTDLDLHVIEPGGSEIYWEVRNGKQGGKMDVDNVNGRGPENIHWEEGFAPRGEYTWWVHYYGGLNGRTRRTKWQVRIYREGSVEVINGELSKIDEISPRKTFQLK